MVMFWVAFEGLVELVELVEFDMFPATGTVITVTFLNAMVEGAQARQVVALHEAQPIGQRAQRPLLK